MNFSELFIRRPVLSIVVSLLILLLGFQGLSNMSIREYPEVEETVITVTTAYPGASADLIQGFITTPIAGAVASVEDVDYVTSSSAQSISTISVRMRLGSDPDAALTEVISKVQQVRAELPEDSENSIIVKGTGMNFALMYLAFASDRMTPPQMTEYLTRVIKPRLSTVEGVSEAQILGAQTFSMRVWIDPNLLAARGVTAAEIANAIRNNNFFSAPGKTENEMMAYVVEADTLLNTPEAFGTIPIRGSGEDVVRLRDVARIELGPDTDDVKVSFQGKEGVFIGITPTPSANPLSTAAAVKAEIPQIQKDLPEGMNAFVVYDATIFIDEAIKEVFFTIAEAVVIVIAVIFLFLGSFRSVIIPIVTIPLSLIGVCFALFALGYSINLLTLLAMVLAIGLVVDDAIVVVENIHRHIEMDKPPVQAAIDGMKEIFGPVVAMTITLAAVYVPIGFTEGLTGSLFREFAFALAGAVIISGIVAVTLSPMMSARILVKQSEERGSFADKIDHYFERLNTWYAGLLEGALAMRGLIVLAVAVLLGLTVYMFYNTNSELAPEEDQGALMSMASGPRYATSNYTKLFVDDFNRLAGEQPSIEQQFSIVGAGGASAATNSAFVIWQLKPWGERDQSQKEVQQIMQDAVKNSAGVEAPVFSPPALPGGSDGLPIQYVIRSIGSPEQVYEVAEEIKARANASGRFIFVMNSMSYDLPQARVLIDRERAAALGVSISDIGNTLNILLSETWMARFDRDNRSYDIIPQVPMEYRLGPESLGGFYVRSISGEMVPLSAVTTIRIEAAPLAIEQFNQLNSATISAMALPGMTNDAGLQALRDIAAEVMPAGFFEDYAGESRLSRQESNTLALTFGLAIIVIYLVLAAQFESFRDPLIILTAVPLSIFGALLPLNLGLGTLNIYTQVGLITLVGLITKHGILMVEFANERREHGMSRLEAIQEAARVRLRPILMTTGAMVLGVVPLIIASGAGASARYSIGLVIASGLTIGTFFTLFVVPVIYTYISHKDPEKVDLSKAAGQQPNINPV